MANPMVLSLLFFSLFKANNFLPAVQQELILPNGFHMHPLRHNNPARLDTANKIVFDLQLVRKDTLEWASFSPTPRGSRGADHVFPVNKLPLMDQEEQQQKRLTLYPTLDMDSNSHTSSQSSSVPAKASWLKHRRPMLWLGHRPSSAAKNGDEGKLDRIRESIQTCLFNFLRSGCEKVQRSHTNQLASFVQNLDVQERISNGFVLRRKSKKKKARQSRRLLR